jgi:hypothetical protein
MASKLLMLSKNSRGSHGNDLNGGKEKFIANSKDLGVARDYKKLILKEFHIL